MHHQFVGQRAIENRRKQENAYVAYDALAAVDKKITLAANFENTTNSKIDRRNRQKMFEDRKKEYEQKLLVRRRNLADLYNQEMELWRKECLAKVETPADRKARIMERAYALRDAREKARLEYVRKKLDDQWRDSCDDARTLDSKALLRFMNDERLNQIKEKREKKQMLSQQEDKFFEEWNRQLEELAKRDAQKNEYRRRIDRETSDGLRRQIENNLKVREDHYRNLQQEELEELTRLRREIEAEEEMQRLRREEAHSRGREIVEFNKENKRIRDQEAEIEKEQNAILLDYALRKEAEQIAMEEAKRNANRESAMKYKKYLEEQMIKEAEDTAFLDEIRRREEEKVWKARDDALKAREDARRYLMQMVDQGRQEQIRYRHEQTIREKEDDKKFLYKFAVDNEEGRRKDEAERERRRNENLANNQELQKQIEIRKMREELERQEAYLADKEMKYREKVHQQKLAEQAGSVRLQYPLQKNNWFT